MMGVGEGSVGEELEREGMSRNWDRVEFTLVVDMWTGTRTETDKFERGRARKMFTAFKALYRSGVLGTCS